MKHSAYLQSLLGATLLSALVPVAASAEDNTTVYLYKDGNIVYSVPSAEVGRFKLASDKSSVTLRDLKDADVHTWAVADVDSMAVRPSETAEVVWCKQFAASGKLYGSSPAVGDANVYVMSTEGNLVALERKYGAQTWTFDLTSDGTTAMTSSKEGPSPSVDPADGRVIIAVGGQVSGTYCRGYALDGATGEQAWSVTWPKTGSRIPWQAPVITTDYIAVSNRATGGSCYIWTKEGKKAASSTVSGIGGGMCAKTDNTFFYAGTGSNGFVTALYADGAFTFPELANSFGKGTVSPNGMQPMIDSKGRLYGASSGTVYCYETNGYTGTEAPTPLWSSAASSGQICKGAGLSMSADGAILFGASQAKEVFALDAATGDVKWNVKTNDECYCVPAVDNLGQVHVCDNAGWYYIYSPTDGSVIFSSKIGDCCYSSPAIADDGTVYIAAEKSGACVLYAFRVAGVTSAADSDWAQFGQNQRHTGVQRTR